MAYSIVDQHLMQNVTMDELGRLQAYREAWEAYHGDFPLPLRTRAGVGADDNVVVNYARVVVDKGVAFLFGQDVRYELDEVEQTSEEDWLQECWGANGGMVTLQKLALNGAVCGHCFLKIVRRAPYPRLVVLDPANIKVGYDPADIDNVRWYRIQYAGLDPNTAKPITYRQIIERDGGVWTIKDQEARGTDNFITVSTERWPYAWPPIVDCQNLPMPNEFYGLSDLPPDVLRLNRSINFVLSNLARIIRFHAHPKTWGKGFVADKLQVAVDETIVLPNPEAELHNLEMISDLSSSISLFERLREALFEATRVPEVATGKLDRAGALSGVALRILYQPLIEKTETKRRTYGAMLVELNRRLLALGGFGEDKRGVLHWPELLPGDPLQERQTALLDQQLGASADTLLQQLGYDPDLEREKRQMGSAQLGEQMLSAFERGE